MKNMFNKANAPYLVSSTLAIATLLASGVFAAAPYVSFLAPVAALSVGLPFIIGGAVFSALIIVLSAAVISKNKTISEKDIQLANQERKIEGEGTEIANLRDQLAEKEQENSTLKDEVTNLGQVIAEQKREIEGKNTELAKKTELIATKDKKIAEDALKVVIANGTIQIARGTVNGAALLAKGVVNGALHCSKYTYKNLPSADSVTETFNNAYGTSVKYTKEVLSSVGNDLKSVNDVLPSTSSVSNLIPSVKTVKLAGLAAAYVAANGGFGVTNNSLMQPANSVGNHTLSSNLPLTYPNPTYQQIVQNKVDEATKKLTDADKWYEDKYVIPAEDSTNHKDASQSVMSRIFSVLRNPWNSLFNGAKKNDNNSEPKRHKDLHKSEDLEKIIDGGILDNLFYPKVDNVINTPKRPGTFFDSVELERLTREAPPSAYSNGLPRVL